MTIAASKFFAMPVAAISPELEARFFSGLKTGNDTFKKTDAGRFSEIDAALAALLAERRGQPLEVLDIGISSGTTTLELKQRLEARRLVPQITGTDQSFEAWLVPGPHGLSALVQPDGHILQFEFRGQALRAWDRRLDRLTGRALFNAALRRSFRDADRELQGQRVDLVSPRLKQAAGIDLRADDILRANPDFASRFDLVRAANILNRDYFDEAQLRSALGHLRSYLKGRGSLLLLVRTDKHSGSNDGTLLRMNPRGRLEPLRRFGKGSEVADLLEL
jgi:hypothetical protein